MFREICNFIFWCMVVCGVGSFVELRDQFKREAGKAHIRGTLELGKWSRKLVSPVTGARP